MSAGGVKLTLCKFDFGQFDRSKNANTVEMMLSVNESRVDFCFAAT